MDTHNIGRLITLVAATAITSFTLLLAGTSTASAEPDWPFTPYVKQLVPSKAQAGTNPDIYLEFAKSKLNQCVEWDETSKSAQKEADQGFCNEFYMEQNFKRIKMSFPAGFLADPNAAPYCDAKQVPSPFGDIDDTLWWQCTNPESLVGKVQMDVQACGEWWNMPDGCVEVSGMPQGIYTIWEGLVYNERPKSGEQGRLAILTPSPDPEDPSLPAPMKVDSVVSVRDSVNSDLGIDAVVDGLPDTYNIGDIVTLAGQVARMDMTLYGNTGAENGHPMFETPRICENQQLAVDFQGYEFNSYMGIVLEAPTDAGTWIAPPGYGDGKTASDSTPYQSTNCDKLPFAPSFSFTTDTSAPGAAAALTTRISQTDDAATIKEVKVVLPAGSGANLQSTVLPCPADALEARTCPETSKLGTAQANSRFLPVDDGPLAGDVYLSELSADGGFKLAVFLDGFIDLRIDGEAKIVNDKFEITFNDLPPVPMSDFTLSLNGGDKGLLTNPRRCGTHFVDATLLSHTGKTYSSTTPLDVSGCDRPTFDVELSERGRSKRTSLELDVRTSGEDIESVRFALPRHLKINEKRLGKASYGSITTVSDRGTIERKLRKGKRTKGVSVRKKRSKKKSKKAKSKKGALKLGAGSTFGSFSASIFKKKVDTGKTIKVRGKRRKVKVTKQRMNLKSLPTDSLSRVGVELNPDEKSFIRMPKPKRCKKPLKFLAFVRTNRSYYVVKQEVKLKCPKKSRKKR